MDFTTDQVLQAIDADAVVLDYQPIVSLAHGKCVGAEALVRLRTGDDRAPPPRFLPAAESGRVAGLLTYRVIELVGREMRDWMTRHPDVRVHINVPPHVFGRGGIEYALGKAGLLEHRTQIVLEVVERGIPDQLGIDAIAELAASGLCVALDDVELTGTNLALLTRAALTMVKLDRALVSTIQEGVSHPQWLLGLASLLRSTPIEVVAEGVESALQADVLREAGVQLAQGFWFAMPMAAADLQRFHATGHVPGLRAAGTP
jgi:sensor c-di-GMP phosphodiesterase-like protein